MKSFEVKVPDIGDYKNVPVIEILVKVGDRVEKDAALMTLESEKATMEVPAPAAGVVRSIKAKVGDKVSQNDVLMSLEAADAPASPAKNFPSPASAGEGQGEGAKPQPPKPLTPALSPQMRGEGEKSITVTVTVTVPDIGDYHDVPVIEVLVSEGASVEKDAPLIVLESEKSTMEVPAPAAGIVRKLAVKAGMKVSKGAAICELVMAGAAQTASVPSPAKAGAGQGEGAAAPTPSPQPSPASGSGSKESVGEGAPPWVGQSKSEIPHASPAIRKLAREFGVDIAKVSGTGPKGRITAEDVQGYTKKALSGAVPAAATGGTGIPAMPAVDFSQFGAIEHKPLARIRKLSAQYLHRAWLNVPHVTQNDEADITELEAFRKAQSEELAGKEGGVKLTLLPFLMKAVAAAMKQYPEFNASLAPDGENLILKKYCNIGFAADTENGLVVPVVKDVWSKGILALAHDCADLAKKARDGKLKPEEMKGGCMSISSLGGIGGSHFTPIVNAPEVAILGVSRAQMKPVWDGKQFAPRLMCPLSLSYDHRVIDGAYAARFIVALGKLISDMRRLAL